jgi:hypothetical protein
MKYSVAVQSRAARRDTSSKNADFPSDEGRRVHVSQENSRSMTRVRGRQNIPRWQQHMSFHLRFSPFGGVVCIIHARLDCIAQKCDVNTKKLHPHEQLKSGMIKDFSATSFAFGRKEWLVKRMIIKLMHQGFERTGPGMTQGHTREPAREVTKSTQLSPVCHLTDIVVRTGFGGF